MIGEFARILLRPAEPDYGHQPEPGRGEESIAPKRWRLPLGVGSVLGLILAIGFGVITALNWWVAVIVALHFVPLAFILSDPSIAVFGVIQLALVIIVGVRLRGSTYPSSRLVGPGPVMGFTLLAYGLISGVLQLVRGLP